VGAIASLILQIPTEGASPKREDQSFTSRPTIPKSSARTARVRDRERLRGRCVAGEERLQIAHLD
jgi:hypothetical protein